MKVLSILFLNIALCCAFIAPAPNSDSLASQTEITQTDSFVSNDLFAEVVSDAPTVKHFSALIPYTGNFTTGDFTVKMETSSDPGADPMPDDPGTVSTSWDSLLTNQAFLLCLSLVLYELLVRLWPTRINASLLDLVQKIIRMMVPNNRLARYDGDEKEFRYFK